MINKAPFATVVALISLVGCLSPAGAVPAFQNFQRIDLASDASKAIRVAQKNCGPDVSTPFPESPNCGAMDAAANSPEPANEPAKKPKRKKAKGRFKCFEGGRYVYTSTYRMGCYAASMDEPGSRPSDALKQLQ